MRTVTAEALMNHSVYQPFLTNAKQALKLCVQYLIDHLPIDTPILVALCYRPSPVVPVPEPN